MQQRFANHLFPLCCIFQIPNQKTPPPFRGQIIRDQTEDHKKKMRELYNILQDTQGQVDRLVNGIKKATLFEKPRTTIYPSHHSNPAWRNTVVSIYVDAEEDYPVQEGGTDGKNVDDESHLEVCVCVVVVYVMIALVLSKREQVNL